MLIDPSNASGIADPATSRIGNTQRILNQLMDYLDVLRKHFVDPEVNEIMINGPDDVWIIKKGRKFHLKVQLGGPNIRSAITLIASLIDKEVGEKSKRRVLSAKLPGFRVEALLPPVAVKGPSMCIRRHASRVLTLEEYVQQGVISDNYATLMLDAITKKKNFLIVGGTGSGKTTLMNTFCSLIPQEERLFVIESVSEMQIVAPDHVLVECDDDQGMTPRKAVRTAMRYRPDRIIVGELRGPEAHDWMDAANTGHPGSGATIHANGANKALSRLENLVLSASMGVPYEAIQASIAETVDILFFIKLDGQKRVVSEACELHGYDRVTKTYDIQNH